MFFFRPPALLTPNTVTVRRVSFGRDSAAGRQGASGSPYPPIRCAVQPASTKDVPEHWREVGSTYFTVKCYDDPGARLRDELTDEQGRLLVVIGTRSTSGGAGRTWLLDCEHKPVPGS